jgi:hypothetical protein
MECFKCPDSPVCKTQNDIFKARLKVIHTANDQYNHDEVRELLNDFEKFLHDMNEVIMEA